MLNDISIVVVDIFPPARVEILDLIQVTSFWNCAGGGATMTWKSYIENVVFHET